MDKIYVNGMIITNRNSQEARRLVETVFERKEYFFPAMSDDPYIIDCGAHIGVATLYFKTLYPTCHVLAIEANPDNIELLRLNIQENGLVDVDVEWGALCNRDGQVSLYIDPDTCSPWSWGDTIVKDIWGANTARAEMKVPAIRLSKFLNRPIDFLKMDIEGAEVEVLEEAADSLLQVAKVVVEFHETAATPRGGLKKIHSILTRANFEVKTMHADWLTIYGYHRTNRTK